MDSSLYSDASNKVLVTSGKKCVGGGGEKRKKPHLKSLFKVKVYKYTIRRKDVHFSCFLEV